MTHHYNIPVTAVYTIEYLILDINRTYNPSSGRETDNPQKQIMSRNNLFKVQVKPNRIKYKVRILFKIKTSKPTCHPQASMLPLSSQQPPYPWHPSSLQFRCANKHSNQNGTIQEIVNHNIKYMAQWLNNIDYPQRNISSQEIELYASQGNTHTHKLTSQDILNM